MTATPKVTSRKFQESSTVNKLIIHFNFIFTVIIYLYCYSMLGFFTRWMGGRQQEQSIQALWFERLRLRIQKSFQIFQVWSLENLIDGQISFGVFLSWNIIVNALQNLKKQPCLQLKRSLGVEASSVSIKLKVQLGLSLTYSRIGTESTVVIMMWAYALLQGKFFSSEIFQILLKMPYVEFRLISIQIGPIYNTSWP